MTHFSEQEEMVFVRSRINPDNRSGRCGRSVKKHFKGKNGQVVRQKEMLSLSSAQVKARYRK